MSSNNNPFGAFLSSLREDAILGGRTDVALTSAATLTRLGVSVEALGSATLRTVGGNAVAEFPITGGTDDSRTGRSVVLHEGSGLALKDGAGTIELENFRIDTRNRAIDTDVTVDGKSAGDLPVFDIGAGNTLTLTEAAARAVDTTLGTTAITSETVIGKASVAPFVAPFSIGTPVLPDAGQPSPGGGRTAPIIGGDTAVTLTSAPVLSSLGVSVRTLGFANFDTSAATPVANFPVTGGTEGPGGADVILHQGSGLRLADAAGTVDLRDFVVDTRDDTIDANVRLNGKSAGNLAVFDIGSNGGLTLTSAAAGAVDKTLGTQAITSATPIGVATPGPIAIPSSPLFGGHDPFASLFAHA